MRDKKGNGFYIKPTYIAIFFVIFGVVELLLGDFVFSIAMLTLAGMSYLQQPTPKNKVIFYALVIIFLIACVLGVYQFLNSKA